jgi:hypothetical protein
MTGENIPVRQKSSKSCFPQNLLLSMQEMGLEPTQPCDYRHLKPARLPFRHSCEQMIFYCIFLQMSIYFLKKNQKYIVENSKFFLTFKCNNAMIIRRCEWKRNLYAEVSELADEQD